MNKKIKHFYFWFQSLESIYFASVDYFSNNFPNYSLNFNHYFDYKILFSFHNSHLSKWNKNSLCTFVDIMHTRPSYSNGLTRTVIKCAMISIFMQDFFFVLFTLVVCRLSTFRSELCQNNALQQHRE